MQRPSGPALVSALFVVIAASIRFLVEKVHLLEAVQIPATENKCASERHSNNTVSVGVTAARH